MRKTQQLSVGWARLVFETLEREGLDASALFKQFDLDESQLSNPSAYFKQDSFTLLWHEASRLSNNPAIGLRMGNNPSVAAFDAYSYSLMSSVNVREGLARTIRYQKIIGSAAQISSETTSDGTLMIFHSQGDELPVAYQGHDAGLALQLFSTRFVTNKAFNPVYAEFMQPEPEDIKPYQDFFQCPLRFSSSRYSMCISEELLDTPLIFANESMAAHHDEILVETINALNNTTMSEKVRDLICKKLPSGEPDIKTIAAMFNISQRTFQRRLKDEGLTFLALLESTRKELAHNYAINETMSLQEITYMLGFTDHSNFYRAFKRWYGCAPGEYREKKKIND